MRTPAVRHVLVSGAEQTHCNSLPGPRQSFRLWSAGSSRGLQSQPGLFAYLALWTCASATSLAFFGRSAAPVSPAASPPLERPRLRREEVPSPSTSEREDAAGAVVGLSVTATSVRSEHIGANDVARVSVPRHSLGLFSRRSGGQVRAGVALPRLESGIQIVGCQPDSFGHSRGLVHVDPPFASLTDPQGGPAGTRRRALSLPPFGRTCHPRSQVRATTRSR